MSAVLQRPRPISVNSARRDEHLLETASADLDGRFAQQRAGRGIDCGDGVRTLVHVGTEHDHGSRPSLRSASWKLGGHGLLRALPRSYQVTPNIPDRRRATQQKEVRPAPGRQPQRESARRRSGPSHLRCRTTPTSRITTASLIATATPRELPLIGRARRAYAPDATAPAEWDFRWSSGAGMCGSAGTTLLFTRKARGLVCQNGTVGGDDVGWRRDVCVGR